MDNKTYKILNSDSDSEDGNLLPFLQQKFLFLVNKPDFNKNNFNKIINLKWNSTYKFLAQFSTSFTNVYNFTHLDFEL